MANIEHASIDDPNIHEPKGISTATADQIYVSDGAGSGDWTDVSDVLAAAGYTMNSILVVKTETNEPQEINASTWTQRTLNQVKTNNISASLSSNRISLVAGTYYIDAVVPMLLKYTDTDQDDSITKVYKSKLYNVTGSTDLVMGTVAGAELDEAYSIGDYQIAFTGYSHIRGVFTLASTSNVELRSWHNFDDALIGGVNDSASGSTNVHTSVTIWRVA